MAHVQATSDVEGALGDMEYLEGYVDFSHFIASDPSLSIYRRFSFLGARNLLYLEAELQLIECELQAFDENDKRTFDGARKNEEKRKEECALRSWDDLKQQANCGDERQAGKLRMIYKLKRLMKEYEKALLRRNQVLALEKPARGPFNAFKNWFRTKEPLWGSGFRLIHDEEDMIALGSQEEPDRMSSLLHRYLGYYFREQRQLPRSWGPIYYYPVEHLSLIIGIVSVMAAAALLVGAIVTLHIVMPMGLRIGFVGIFTVVFATSIMLLTHARRVEVYGATAAYAAVLVVFISVNN